MVIFFCSRYIKNLNFQDLFSFTGILLNNYFLCFADAVSTSSSPKLLNYKYNISQASDQVPPVCASPLVPRRNDYEPTHRVTIQRQQRVHSPPTSANTTNPNRTNRLALNVSTPNNNNNTFANNVPYNRNYSMNSPSNTSHQNNASDSGLSGIEDNNSGNCRSNSDLSEAHKNCLMAPAVLLSRPATLDLKPSFINTSKQSEGISLSPASNEDEAFAIENHIGVIQNSPASCIRTQYKVSSPSIIKRKLENTNKELLQISSSLSLSSSMASSSVPSSISPSATSSPRQFHMQSQSISSNTLQSNKSSNHSSSHDQLPPQAVSSKTNKNSSKA